MRSRNLLYVLFSVTFARETACFCFDHSRRRHDRVAHLPLDDTSRRRTPCLSSSRSPQQQKNQSKKKRSSKPERLLLKKQPDLATQLDYARNGHAVLRDFVPQQTLASLYQQLKELIRGKELSAWQQKVVVASNGKYSCDSIPACQAKLAELLGDDTPLPFLQFFNTWKDLPDVYSLACTLAETASILMNVPSVRLYQDSVFWKRPSDGATPWHADARMAPFDTSHLVTFWIPLHDVHESGLVFCSKTHADFALPYWNPPTEWENLEERYAENEIVDYMPLRVGDVTVHSGWTLHCADPSSESRLALAISFVDARAPVRVGVKVDDEKSSSSSTNDYGDNEDSWSYRDWIDQVPRGSYEWTHELVPIVYPPKQQKKNAGKRHP